MYCFSNVSSKDTASIAAEWIRTAIVKMINNLTYNFSITEGLAYQQADLKRWMKVLNDETFAALQRECIQRNVALTDGPLAGDKVFRGQDILEFIISLTHKK